MTLCRLCQLILYTKTVNGRKKKTWNILSCYVCMAPVITEVNLIVMFIMLLSSYNGSALFDREAISRLKNLIPQVWKKIQHRPVFNWTELRQNNAWSKETEIRDTVGFFLVICNPGRKWNQSQPLGLSVQKVTTFMKWNKIKLFAFRSNFVLLTGKLENK